MMEQSPDVQEDDLGTGGKFKTWLQDNIRIILSVLIVFAIAGGIYSYSKRTEAPTGEELAMQEGIEDQLSLDQPSEPQEAVTITGEEEKKEETTQETTKEEPKQEPQQEEQKEVAQQPQTQQPQDVRVETPDTGSQMTTSEETGAGFIETAVRGDSRTTLARKAVRDYLEKNADSSLTAEHKIYIEDYLQKRIGGKTRILVGEQLTFSNEMIKESIEKSKTLNEQQLQNLKQYSSRVSNL